MKEETDSKVNKLNTNYIVRIAMIDMIVGGGRLLQSCYFSSCRSPPIPDVMFAALKKPKQQTKHQEWKCANRIRTSTKIDVYNCCCTVIGITIHACNTRMSTLIHYHPKHQHHTTDAVGLTCRQWLHVKHKIYFCHGFHPIS